MSKKPNKIDLEEMSNYFRYDPETGHLYWNWLFRRRSKKGRPAGVKNGQGYIHINLNGKAYGAHRIAWTLYHKKEPKYHIDHIDGKPSNNKIDNLRDVPPILNLLNKKAHRDGKVPGAWYCAKRKTKKWRSAITINRKVKELGFFHTKEEAAEAFQIELNQLLKQYK